MLHSRTPVIPARRRQGLVPAVLLCVGVLLAGRVPLTQAQDRSFETLRVAFIGKSSDDSLDRSLYQAAVLAAEQINAGDDDDEAGLRAGDDTRYSLDVAYYEADTADDVSDVLDDIADDDAIAILGPQDIKAAQALTSDSAGLAVLLGASNAPTGTNLFHLVATPTQRVEAAADYLVNERHFTSIGLIAINTTEAQTGIDRFKAVSGDDVIAADLTHEPDETDFSADVKRIRENDVDALFVWTLDSQMIALLGELKDSGWKGTVVYEGLDAGFVAQAGDLARGVVGLVPWTTSAYDDDSHHFVADYTQRWNAAPTAEAAAYYDAVYLLAAAVSEVDPSASTVKTALSQQGEQDEVVGTYTKAESSALRVVTAGESLAEVVRYDAGACVNCPDTWWADSSSDTASSQETFRIGLIATLDGSAQGRGEQMEQAARLAIREINDAGGIVSASGVRYTLDLLTYSAATADDTSTAFDQAVADGVDLILGPDYNAQILPNLYRAEDAALIQLVSATMDQISTNDSANYVFQLRTADTSLAAAAAHYLLDERDILNVATVAARTDYGLDAVDAFTSVINSDEDADVVLELDHDIEQTDFADMASQIASAQVGAVAVWTSQPAALALLNDLNQLGWKGVFVYGYITSEFAASLPTDSTIEVVGPVNWDDSAGDWVSQDFATRYQARYGEAPIAQAAAYYDAVHLIGRGLEEKEASGLREWLLNVSAFRGVQGEYAPNTYANGELTRSALMLEVAPEHVTLAQYDNGACVLGCDE